VHVGRAAGVPLSAERAVQSQWSGISNNGRNKLGCGEYTLDTSI